MSLAHLQLLNPQLFQPLREPTVNISLAILCTFFPPPVAPALPCSPPTPSSQVAAPSVEAGRSSPPPSFFSFSGVKSSLGFASSNPPPLQLGPLVPTAAAVPAPLSLSASSRLYCAGGGESFVLGHVGPHPPCLPHWASTAVQGGAGGLGATCKLHKVSYAVVFTSDGNSVAAAAAAAAAAATRGSGGGDDSASRM